tara:strand:- start:71 stop:259 length:189 start_codon:yes stop_codon:yes gene_type:complete
VRNLKSFKTLVPKVSSPKPATNIINEAILYLLASEPLLSKNVSAAKEFTLGKACLAVFHLDD